MRLCLLILVLRAFAGRAQQIEQCDSNPCRNGGVCTKAGDTVLAAHCEEGFFRYGYSCYNFVQSPRTWDEAQRHCAVLRAHGLQIDSQHERLFASAYLQQHLASQGSAVERKGLWLSGRAEGVWGNETWVWRPADVPIETLFWQSGEPSFHETEHCVQVSADSLYADWRSRPCNERSFYMCEKPAIRPATEATLRYAYQCKCLDGFSGVHCELATLTVPPEAASQAATCSSDELRLACPQTVGAPTQLILIDYAAFGMPATRLPGHCFGQPGELNCAAENSLPLVRQLCQGRAVCHLPTVSQYFAASPCLPASSTFLEYRMRCSQTPLECPPGSELFGGRCFRIYYESRRKWRKSWPDARSVCLTEGGDLADAVDADTHRFLSERLKLYERQKAKRFWLGFRTTKMDGALWNNRLPLAFQPSGSQIVGASELCGAYDVPMTRAQQQAQGELTWQTKPCEMAYNWICEFPAFDVAQQFLETRVTSSHLSSTSTPISSSTQPLTFRFSTNLGYFPMITSTLAATTATLSSQSSTSQPAVSSTLSPASRTTSLPDEWNVWTPAADTSTVAPSSSTPTPSGGAATDDCAPTFARDIHWPQTAAGETAVASCPDGATGTAVWRCAAEGAFGPGSPDLSHCRHEWVADVEAAVAAGDDALAIADLLNGHLVATERLLGGDVVGAANSAADVVALADKQLGSPQPRVHHHDHAANVAQAVGTTVDFLLNEDNLVVWNDLPEETRRSEAAALMGTTEDAAHLMSRFLGLRMQRQFDFDTISMKVELVGIGGRPAAIAEDPVGAPSASSFGANESAIVRLPSYNFLRGSSDGDRRGVLPSDDEQPLRLQYVLFDSLGALLPSDGRRTVNSRVLSVSVGRRRLSLPDAQPATFTFWHLRTDANLSNPSCVYWNTSFSDWRTDGCSLVRTTAALTECACTHLTSFAILMDVGASLDGGGGGPTHDVVLTWLTVVGCTVSISCLLVCVVVFCFFPALWCERNTIHRHLCLCLLLAECIFLFGIELSDQQHVCTWVAVGMHYFFLASFCWMLLEGYQLYVMLVRVFEGNSRLVYFYLFGYGFPLLVVGASAAVRLDSYGTERYCWIDVTTDAVWTFVGPITVIAAINLLVLCVAFRSVFRVKGHHERSKLQKLRGWLKGSLMLLCLLGITWLFGYLMLVKDVSLAFAYVFTVANSLQGLFIFVFHVLFNEKVSAALFRCFGGGSSFSGSSAFNSSSNNSAPKRNTTKGSGSSGSTDSTDAQSTRAALSGSGAARWRPASFGNFGAADKPAAGGAFADERNTRAHLCSKDCGAAHSYYPTIVEYKDADDLRDAVVNTTLIERF